MLSDFFQIGALPSHQLFGTYDLRLVFLSYLVATFASYIALDIAGRLHDENNTRLTNFFWLMGGSFAMGAGIWSMHFIGMLAFRMEMPMSYNTFWTIASMFAAMLASLLALSLLMGENIGWPKLAFGGIFIGLGIATMHYLGMYAMTDSMTIHYIPSLFALSILIAIVASEAALWLAIRSNQGVLRTRIRLKIFSALIMGAAICGMHYTGMYSAIFTAKPDMMHDVGLLNPEMLSISVAGVTFLILGVAFALSTYKETANQQLITTARLTGMAEVASNVLHNVGNILNSLNVSVILISEKIDKSKISDLKNVTQLLTDNKHSLGEYITQDEKGSHIPEYLAALSDYWIEERKSLLLEIQSLQKHIQHIKDIISTQQSLGAYSLMEQLTAIDSVIDEAILITGLSLCSPPITVNKDYELLNPVFLDKIKLLQILVNLLRNAKDSLVQSNQPQKTIDISLHILSSKHIELVVSDNGIGIDAKHLSQIFSHGFSTKKSGHGFGLHSCAILAKQMDGSLIAKSDGKGQGATFTLILPYIHHAKKSVINKLNQSLEENSDG